MKYILIVMLIALATGSPAFAQRQPVTEELIQISQVPPDIPQRISGMAFDGVRLWFSVYHRGRFAAYDPQADEWAYFDDQMELAAVRQISQPFSSTSGIAFNGRVMWMGGSYGESLGAINLHSLQIEKHFTGKLRPDLENSQGYSSLAHDGRNLWAAWHMTEYKRPVSESQQLLKLDPDSGKIVARFPLPAGTRPDMTHGLTFDGQNLWHIKDTNLTAIDLDGKILSRHVLKKLCRPSGLAWDGESLYIVEFSGRLWKLPLKG